MLGLHQEGKEPQGKILNKYERKNLEIRLLWRLKGAWMCQALSLQSPQVMEHIQVKVLYLLILNFILFDVDLLCMGEESVYLKGKNIKKEHPSYTLIMLMQVMPWLELDMWFLSVIFIMFLECKFINFQNWKIV